MARQGGDLSWLYDATRRQYYWVDSRDGSFVYQNGVRIPPPQPTIPRTINPVSPASLPAVQPEFGTSPTRNEGNFSLGGRARHGGPAAAMPYTADARGAQTLPASMAALGLGDPATSTFQPQRAAPQSVPQPPTPVGVNVVTAQDGTTGVTVRVGTGPADRITDPYLYGSGVSARRALYGTAGETEYLFSNFKKRKHEFFIFGRVFLVLWSEPAGDTATAIDSEIPTNRYAPGLLPGRHGERIYSKVRRFVVIRPGKDYCTALPITSYGGRGVSKVGVEKSEHGIIYTGSVAPNPRVDERPGRNEGGMRARPIHVVPDDPDGKLDVMSRIDFAKVHTIQHNLKVATFGVVHPDSEEALTTQFSNVWAQQVRSRTIRPSANPTGARVTSSQAGISSSSRQIGTIDEVSENESGGRGLQSTTQMRGASTAVTQAKIQAAQRAQPTAAQAQNVRLAMHRLTQEGQTQEQAFDIILQRYTNTGYTREAATALIRGAVPHSRVSVPSTGGGAGRTARHSPESSEEGESSSDDGDSDSSD